MQPKKSITDRISAYNERKTISENQAVIIDRFRRGELTKVQAEDQARKQGLGVLGSVEKSRFDVLGELFWSSEMAFAWVMWRSYEKVIEQFNPYRSAGLQWEKKTVLRPIRKVYWELNPVPPACLNSMKTTCNDRLERAMFELKNALFAGNLAATCIDVAKGEVKEIRSFEWSHLDFMFMPDAPSMVYRMIDVPRPLYRDAWLSREAQPSNVALYKDVKLRSIDLLKIWPAPVESQAGKRGRQFKYDWEPYEAEVIRMLDHEGGISIKTDPNFTQATVVEEMLKWCVKNWSCEPSFSSAKEHAKKAIEKYNEIQASKSRF